MEAHSQVVDVIVQETDDAIGTIEHDHCRSTARKISYCFGVPSEQYLTQGIDRSLIRPCHVGSCSGGHVDHNRRRGLQAAGWSERREIRRGELLSRQIVVLSKSAPLSRITSPFWLGRAITSWPSGGWKSPEVYQGPVSSTGSSLRIDGFARLIIRGDTLSVRDTRPRLRTPGR